LLFASSFRFLDGHKDCRSWLNISYGWGRSIWLVECLFSPSHREVAKALVEGNKGAECLGWEPSAGPRTHAHKHTYWWIFHVQPQSEHQKTLMFVYTSVLLSRIQVVLIKDYSNTRRIQRVSHRPTRPPARRGGTPPPPKPLSSSSCRVGLIEVARRVPQHPQFLLELFILERKPSYWRQTSSKTIYSFVKIKSFPKCSAKQFICCCCLRLFSAEINPYVVLCWVDCTH